MQRQEGLQILGGVEYFTSVLKKTRDNQRTNTQNSVSVNLNAEPRKYQVQKTAETKRGKKKQKLRLHSYYSKGPPNP